MDTTINKNKSLFAVFTVLGVMVLSGCGQGMVGADGAVLLNYLPPENLKQVTDDPTGESWLPHGDIMILDVRPGSFYDLGHIPTAESFPSDGIMSRLGEIPMDKYLIIYCETGGRAALVAAQLNDAGYTRWMNWGGFIRWPY